MQGRAISILVLDPRSSDLSSSMADSGCWGSVIRGSEEGSLFPEGLLVLKDLWCKEN